MKKNAAKPQANNSKYIIEFSTLRSSFNAQIAQYVKPHAKCLLAFSGGLDSTVLLHLLYQLRKSYPMELHALHVHHGLSPNADEWADFCTNVCLSYNVPVKVVRVDLSQHGKLGTEAAARKLRYQALVEYQINNETPDFILTAHHQNDQAETLLLQLFRGAGVKGLSSMPHYDAVSRTLRPLLGTSRSTLSEYAKAHQLSWCEDESNANTDYSRNFLRHQIIPKIEHHYPSVQSQLAKTANHLAEASKLLDALAALDAKSLIDCNRLSLDGIKTLDIGRTKNLMRWWFAQNKLSMPSEAHLAQILHQLLTAKLEANVSIKLEHLTLKRYQQHAYLVSLDQTKPFNFAWSGESQLITPNGGVVVIRQVMGQGLALKYGLNELSVASRRGRATLKMNANGPTKTLKNLLQDVNIPPWQRDSYPLVYRRNQLVAIPNIGVCAELSATGDEIGLIFNFNP